MGEVYKARDTKLDREVAIKVSAQQFSERFECEAQAIAALNQGDSFVADKPRLWSEKRLADRGNKLISISLL
jgi:hypothetical protein